MYACEVVDNHSPIHFVGSPLQQGRPLIRLFEKREYVSLTYFDSDVAPLKNQSEHTNFVEFFGLFTIGHIDGWLNIGWFNANKRGGGGRGCRNGRRTQ
jgi:hypothetical protein